MNEKEIELKILRSNVHVYCCLIDELEKKLDNLRDKIKKLEGWGYEI